MRQSTEGAELSAESDHGSPRPRRPAGPTPPSLAWTATGTSALLLPASNRALVRASLQNPSPACPSSTPVGTLLPHGLGAAVPLPHIVSPVTLVPMASPPLPSPSLLTWPLLNTTLPVTLSETRESYLALPSPHPSPFLGFRFSFAKAYLLFLCPLYFTYFNCFLWPLLGCQLQEGGDLSLFCSETGMQDRAWAHDRCPLNPVV